MMVRKPASPGELNPSAGTISKLRLSAPTSTLARIQGSFVYAPPHFLF
jgi:hypothetical protein